MAIDLGQLALDLAGNYLNKKATNLVVRTPEVALPQLGGIDMATGKQVNLNDFVIEKTHHIWKNIENDGENCGQIFILLTVSGTTGEDSITSLKVVEDEIKRYH